MKAAKGIIIFRTDANEDVLRLSGASYMRELSFGTTWTTLRVGIRGRWLAGSTNPLTFGDGITPRLGIGLAASSGSMARRAVCKHYCGALTTGASWAVSSPGAGDFNLNFGSVAPAKKVGSSFTVGANFTTNIGLCTGLEPTPFRLNPSMIFVDITKGAPNYSLRLFGIGNPSNGGGQTRATWLAQMQLATPTQVNYAFDAARTVAVDEATDGVFDSINIFNELPIEFEVWDHGLVLLA